MRDARTELVICQGRLAAIARKAWMRKPVMLAKDSGSLTEVDEGGPREDAPEHVEPQEEDWVE